jgi:tetratricopeptide (TPR) repeat protein
MREETKRGPALPLHRPARLRPSLTRLVRLLLVFALCGLCAVMLGRRIDITVTGAQPDCAALARTDPTAHVLATCRREFDRTRDPKTGARLAHVLRKAGHVEDARRIATSLLRTLARPDALRVLGDIALREEKYEDAIAVLEPARVLHRILQEPLELARDDSVLALVRSERNEYAEALRLLGECIELVERHPDGPQELYCRTVAARTLISLGYFAAADDEITKAEPLAASNEARIDLQYQRANLAQETGNHALAIEILERVLRDSEHSVSPDRMAIREQNLAFSLAELGRTTNARRHLENARRLDRNQKQAAELTWTAAQIAYKEGDLDQAALLTKAYFELLAADDDLDRDDRIDVAGLAARVELLRNNLPSAASWAWQAIGEAERVRGEQSALELRATVLTKRRLPYELRFLAFARRGQVENAALAFDQWQGRTVQDALARPRLRVPIALADIADQLVRLGPWARVALDAPFARNVDRSSVLRTMRDIDLLALIVADGQVWRLSASHGPPRLAVVGPFSEIDERVRDVSSHPTNVEPAAALGALLVPDDLFKRTSETLHVVLDGQLAVLPVAALRHGTTPLIELRPIVRELRLPDVHCVPVVRSGRATVLGDPFDKLPDARIEAAEVATLLHTTSKTGSAAIKAALFAAANGAVLHVATRSGRGSDGPALELFDGNASALEISASRLAPSLVVLSSCDAATANKNDDELASSLVAGFLAAGSLHVVATLMSVDDSGAREITTRFYGAGGVADPVRALQTAQRELLETGNVDWPQYTVFGPDVCLQAALDHP